MTISAARNRIARLRYFWERVNQLAPGEWSEEEDYFEGGEPPFRRSQLVFRRKSHFTYPVMFKIADTANSDAKWNAAEGQAVMEFIAELHNAALWLISATADYIELSPDYSEITRNNAKLVEQNARLQREIDELKLGSTKEI
jgi:hypothetical protein